MRYHTKNHHLDTFFIYGISVSLVVILSIVSLLSPEVTLPPIHAVESKKEPQAFFDTRAFSDIQVQAKAYVIYDITTSEIIASKNETALLPLASITKVMTAISSTLHKDVTAKININPASVEGGYDLGLKKNQVWSLGELLKYILVFSSNDGAQAISDSFGGNSIFVLQMNTDAKSLGLTAIFTDPAGRDIGKNIGGIGTALDVAKIFTIARKNIPELLDATTKKRSTTTASGEKVSGIPNTNQEVEEFPGAEASKTGYTDMAGGNLGVIVDVTIGRPVVLVVLGSTKEGRFKDIHTLYEALLKSIIESTESNTQPN